MRLTTSVLAPLRPVARSFTGSTYVLLGFDALRAPGGRVEQAGPVLAAIRKAVPLPDDDELVVRANAALQVVCGAMLAMGRWAIEDPATRKIQRIQFHKNLAMIGGLIFSALDEPLTRPE
jgi:uncharacterized membrane protein YphA (DoxX/SURF4 family)